MFVSRLCTFWCSSVRCGPDRPQIFRAAAPTLQREFVFGRLWRTNEDSFFSPFHFQIWSVDSKLGGVSDRFCDYLCEHCCFGGQLQFMNTRFTRPSKQISKSSRWTRLPRLPPLPHFLSRCFLPSALAGLLLGPNYSNCDRQSEAVGTPFCNYFAGPPYMTSSEKEDQNWTQICGHTITKYRNVVDWRQEGVKTQELRKKLASCSKMDVSSFFADGLLVLLPFILFDIKCLPAGKLLRLRSRIFFLFGHLARHFHEAAKSVWDSGVDGMVFDAFRNFSLARRKLSYIIRFALIGLACISWN